jgi:DNA-binding transcriptional MerR regulator
MKLYQIAELEQLTGIKAHTIRIWEQRHNLIKPQRTETNIRRYNDEQVKKMLNVAALLSEGYKISKIAALKEKEILQAVAEIRKTSTDRIAYQTYINDLIAAMLNFDGPLFEKTYHSVVKKLGVFDAMLHVIYPLLNKIGFMWMVNDAIPIQEHFASNIIKRKLIAAADNLPLINKRKKFLLILPPNEWHDIGLLFANYIIKAKGYEATYFGQNVPYENINLAVKTIKPDYLVMFFIAPRNPKNIYSEFKKNVHLPKNVALLVSGNPTITSYLENKKKITILKSPNDLLDYLT